MSSPRGTFVGFYHLSKDHQALVQLAWCGAKSSAEHKLCFQSNFPVGAAIRAANAAGETKNFAGGTVENHFFPQTICAERNAAMTAALEGYTHFQAVAVVCAKYPGADGSLCGLCRQVLNQFGRDAMLLNVVNCNSGVYLSTVGDLLPAAIGQPQTYDSLDAEDRRVIRRLVNLKSRSHVPGSKRPRSALFYARNQHGKLRIFEGVSDDNASYGGSALAEAVAMRTARTAGFGVAQQLIITVDDPTAVNQIDGECLQVLREFGKRAVIRLVGPDQSVLTTTLSQLLPDSFGPEHL